MSKLSNLGPEPLPPNTSTHKPQPFLNKTFRGLFMASSGGKSVSVYPSLVAVVDFWSSIGIEIRLIFPASTLMATPWCPVCLGPLSSHLLAR